MARIVIAWELGAGLGHLTRLAQLGRGLLERGHRIAFALRDLSLAHQALLPELNAARPDSGQFSLWQAPIWLPATVGLSPLAANYAELLLRFGYGAAPRLLGLVDAWRNLLYSFNADALIADHAPTAVLAAHTSAVPVALFGNAFTCPPRCSPMPPFAEPTDLEPGRLQWGEATALNTINTLLEYYRRPTLAHLSALFDVPLNVITQLRESDAFAQWRTDEYYCGPLEPLTGMAAPTWPDRPGPRVFAYLNNGFPHLRTLCAQLASTGFPTCMYLSGAEARLTTSLCTPSMTVLARSVDLRDALVDSAAVVCHGGSGLVSSALEHGVPLIIAPLQLEQKITARHLAAAGLAIHLPLADPAEPGTPGPTPDLRSALQRLIDEPAWKVASSNVARGYFQDTHAERSAKLLDALENRLLKTIG